MESYLTRRQVLVAAATVFAGPLVSAEVRMREPRDQVIRYSGWVLRQSDLQPLDSKRA